MARIVGSDGGCSVDGYDMKFTTWSATFSQVVTDTSAFGDTFAQKRGGLMSGTFSAGGVLYDGEGNSAPMPVRRPRLLTVSSPAQSRSHGQNPKAVTHGQNRRF